MLIPFILSFSFVITVISSDRNVSQSIEFSANATQDNYTTPLPNAENTALQKIPSNKAGEEKLYANLTECQGPLCEEQYKMYGANLLHNNNKTLIVKDMAKEKQDSSSNNSKVYVKDFYQNSSMRISNNKTDFNLNDIKPIKNNDSLTVPPAVNKTIMQIGATSTLDVDIIPEKRVKVITEQLESKQKAGEIIIPSDLNRNATNQNENDLIANANDINETVHNRTQSETNENEINTGEQLDKKVLTSISGEKINETLEDTNNYQKLALSQEKVFNKVVRNEHNYSLDDENLSVAGQRNASTRENIKSYQNVSTEKSWISHTGLKPNTTKRTSNISQEQSITKKRSSVNDRLSPNNEGVKDPENPVATVSSLDSLRINQIHEQDRNTAKSLTQADVDLSEPTTAQSVQIKVKATTEGAPLSSTWQIVNPGTVTAKVATTTATSLQQSGEKEVGAAGNTPHWDAFNFTGDYAHASTALDTTATYVRHTTRSVQDPVTIPSSESPRKNYGILKLLNATTKRPNPITDLKTHLVNGHVPNKTASATRKTIELPLNPTEIDINSFLDVYATLTTAKVPADNTTVTKMLTEMPWPVKKEAVVEGDLVLGGLMMVHEREDSITCGPVMPQGGIQALEAMLYTLDRLNNARDPLLPNITIGAHILDDCDKDTYGLEMAVDFIKGM